ncbi:hypothetical protein FOZ62_027799, partial [Perkinsus olseni]
RALRVCFTHHSWDIRSSVLPAKQLLQYSRPTALFTFGNWLNRNFRNIPESGISQLVGHRARLMWELPTRKAHPPLCANQRRKPQNEGLTFVGDISLDSLLEQAAQSSCASAAMTGQQGRREPNADSGGPAEQYVDYVIRCCLNSRQQWQHSALTFLDAGIALVPHLKQGRGYFSAIEQYPGRAVKVGVRVEEAEVEVAVEKVEAAVEEEVASPR